MSSYSSYIDDFYFEIDGVNILKFLAYQGIKWQRDDLDGPNAGRTLDGTMQRDRVATKIRMDLSCRPLRSEEAKIILNLILPEYVQVHYVDPMLGETTKTMYSNNNTATHMYIDDYGNEWWSGIDFALVEQ